MCVLAEPIISEASRPSTDPSHPVPRGVRPPRQWLALHGPVQRLRIEPPRRHDHPPRFRSRQEERQHRPERPQASPQFGEVTRSYPPPTIQTGAQTMDSPGPDEIATALAEVDRRIGAINAALRAMPDGRRNTRFHIDRVNARRRLAEQLAVPAGQASRDRACQTEKLEMPWGLGRGERPQAPSVLPQPVRVQEFRLCPAYCIDSTSPDPRVVRARRLVARALLHSPARAGIAAHVRGDGRTLRSMPRSSRLPTTSTKPPSVLVDAFPAVPQSSNEWDGRGRWEPTATVRAIPPELDELRLCRTVPDFFISHHPRTRLLGCPVQPDGILPLPDLRRSPRPEPTPVRPQRSRLAGLSTPLRRG